MYFKVAYSNNTDVCAEDQILNVYVTAERVTVRIMHPYAGSVDGYVPGTFEDLFSHEIFGDEEYLKTNPERVFKNSDGKLYNINYQSFISLRDIKEWLPYAEIAVCTSASNKVRTKPSFAKFKKLLAFDIIPRTYLNKKLAFNSNKRTSFFTNHSIETQLSRVVNFVVYRDGLDFLSCPMCIYFNKLLHTNIDIDYYGVWNSGEEQEITNTYWRTELFSPKFKFDDSVTEIKANERITLDVELYNTANVDVNDRTFTLEAISGYLPHKRLNIVNNKGQFDIIALGLKPGEQLRVKINDRFFTSRGEKILTVV